jgi:hypothetical protein
MSREFCVVTRDLIANHLVMIAKPPQKKLFVCFFVVSLPPRVVGWVTNC